MGQQAKQFPPPQAIGAVNRPNDILSQSIAPPPLAQNALQPLIQNQIPFMATANAVPSAPQLGNPYAPYQPFSKQQFGGDQQYNNSSF